MDAVEAILTRNSVPPASLGDPAPDGDALRTILAAAMRAPDHGAIRPWRFHLVRGEARARLGEVFAQALLKREPAADAAALDRERGRPLRSPLVIVACAEVVPDKPTVPVVEQIVATGAAVQNMMNAAHALGFGAFLATGGNARDPHVKAAFGLAEKDEIVGFVYFGTPPAVLRTKPRPEAEAYAAEWTGV